MEVFLLTGPINSGKTTRLTRWCTTHKGVAGLLSPKLENGRCFQDIRTGEIVNMEAAGGEVIVGRYRFSKPVFDWANRVLIYEAGYRETNWLIIDELGLLELRGEGLDPALQYVFSDAHPGKNPDLKVVLVIRESLIQQIRDHYNLARFPVSALEIST